MKSRRFSAARLCASLAVVLGLLCCGVAEAEEEEKIPELPPQEVVKRFSTGNAFFDDARITGGLYYFQRHRLRYSMEEDRYANNLDHISTQASMDVSSGMYRDVLGFDFGAFTSGDLRNRAAVDHEMGFVPWRDPWHAKWDRTDTVAGASIYKAHAKFTSGPVWGKAGYFQPSGPGVLGVNWSLLPGTYQGAEVGANFGKLSLAGAWVDKYKAPWYRDTYHFSQRDGETDVAWLASLGAKYAFENGLTLELAYGQSQGYLHNGHFKSGYTLPVGEGTFAVGYHLYGMADGDSSGSLARDHFSGVAWHHFLYSSYTQGAWTVRLESTYTVARQREAQHLGYFAYRLTVPSGSSKGAYDAWWDARSDWNADDEKAVFLGVSRTLDDLLPFAGMRAGAGAAYGWDGRGYGVSERLREGALTFDLGYIHPHGSLQGAWINLHYTEYWNGSAQPSWVGYQNAFQDERDLKIIAGIPLSF